MAGVEAGWTDVIRLAAVFFLVLANGFFVAAEFSLVAVRRSRVAELVASGQRNAAALQKAIDHLDGNLAATQLGITISSLALGWIGEPALAHLIEPLLAFLPGNLASIGSHTLAVVIAFTIITALHIVLGELAPKSLALQRSEATALAVVQPLAIFQLIFRPAIVTLNGMGNLVLRLVGLHAGEGPASNYSPEELKLLMAASQRAGVLQQAQLEVVERVINLSNRRIGDFMTPRLDIEWVDADDPPEEILKTIRECRHAQLLVSRGELDEVIGIVLKEDLLDNALDHRSIDVARLAREPLVVHEATPFLRILEQFKQKPVRLAVIVDEYGGIEGIITQTDLLEAIAGELPGVDDEEPSVVERADGSLLIDGMMPAHEAFDRIGLRDLPQTGDFHTIAGFFLHELGRIPSVGDTVTWQGWRFEVVDMDSRRVDKLLVSRVETD
ncbi:CBS domain containing-hemolysin-like protein [Pseudochelatococcus lubricantis]|uniref:CBS domain containing-hemolysin-like protein n=1 Tax=Pseudochelatococcus lubricantis TaxID=1538102 RepID=A0ABX0V5W5_9HYPH|nr:hemolysin family protein [Pseudochelatococcus lubricantis]NIJ58521.1 CBS domain containing-hemolysin-like protein [Pseudochelatococcus lubricantis]